MTFQPGDRLGSYEIVSLAGAGGMGEVYRALDTRLNRTVAIKALPPELSVDPELRDRFEREARAIAALSHPHICTLFDIGEAVPDLRASSHDSRAPIRFLVMEYLDGETLAARLARGALPIDQALACAVAIAGALDKAHRQGIVHRDLKPGNIMLAKSGAGSSGAAQAKLLDFGLARLRPAGPVAAFSGATAIPTELAALTTKGTILGTLQYMAPEQLEGREADARTDIFAFGTVLYEMVTGKKAFEGKSQVSLIGAILEREPAPPSSLQPASPPTLDAVIKRCLAKDPDDRWQSAADLGVALKWLESTATATTTSTTMQMPASHKPKPARRPIAWMIAAVVFAVTTLTLGALEIYRRISAAPAEIVRLSIQPPEKTTFDDVVGFGSFNAGRVSPDGRRIVFTAKDASGKVQLWLRALDSLTAQPLAGTEGGFLPFWSPDSRWIAYQSNFNAIKRIDIAGGAPETLCAEPNIGGGGTWNLEGVILASSQTGIRRIGPSGCPAITKPIAGVVAHIFPFFLPDGRHFIYYAVGTTPEKSRVHVASLDSTDDRALLAADSAAIYSRSGHLLFVRQGTLFAQPFDAKALAVTRDPIRIAQSIPSDLGAPAFSVSDTGVLTYRTGLTVQDLQFAWFDRSGKRLGTVGPPGNYRGVDLSPDGTRIAVHRHDEQGGDVWVFEPRGTATRLTFDTAQHNSSPIWSPDGRFIVFGSVRNGKAGLYRKASDGTGAEELLTESEVGKLPTAWSPDGKYIVYWLYEKGGTDQWLLPLTGDRRPTPLLNSSFFESHSQVSPDGKWMAYYSDETGRTEVYVRPFPSGEGRWQVSTNGGQFPRWRRDGKEIFYMTGTGLGTSNPAILAVPVQASGSTFEAGAPKALFESGYVDLAHVGAGGGNYHTYAVSPDGQRFLIPRSVAATQDTATTPIMVVLNWTATLDRK